MEVLEASPQILIKTHFDQSANHRELFEKLVRFFPTRCGPASSKFIKDSSCTVLDAETTIVEDDYYSDLMLYVC